MPENQASAEDSPSSEQGQPPWPARRFVEEQAVPPGELSAPRILIVEDEAAIRRICTIALGRQGYEAVAVEDGEAGWAQLVAGDFHLLLTDQDMPKLTGLALIHRARTHGLTLPCVLMSGRIPWDDPDLVALVPPEARFPKPFSIDGLVAKVARFVEVAAAAR